MRRWACVVVALALAAGIVSRAQAQDLISGSWAYRSFRNDPAPVGDDAKKALALIFGEGALQLAAAADGTITGQVDFGGGFVLDIAGTVAASPPGLISLRGTGRQNTPTAGWIYDYQSFPAPKWPYGVNQRPALVGTVIRAAPHNGAPAGVTASFIAVRAD